jgi:hypothetical protein
MLRGILRSAFGVGLMFSVAVAAPAPAYLVTKSLKNKPLSTVASIAEFAFARNEIGDFERVLRFSITEFSEDTMAANIQGLLEDQGISTAWIEPLTSGREDVRKATANLNGDVQDEPAILKALEDISLQVDQVLFSRDRLLFGVDTVGVNASSQESGFAIVDRKANEVLVVLTGTND